MATPYPEIQRSLGRIEGKLDSIKERLSKGEDRFEKVEARVVGVERRVWAFTGAIGVAGTALGAFMKYFYTGGST